MKNNWTEEELKHADDYAFSSDHETTEEQFNYVATMMSQCGLDFPERTPAAYRNKLYSYWKTKRNPTS